MKRFFLSVVLLCLSTSLVGCAGMQARNAQRRYIHEQTAQHRYASSCGPILAEVRKMLFEDGFSIKTVDPSLNMFETEWSVSERASGDLQEERYLVHGKQLQPELCAITITHAEANDSGVETSRDFDFEWSVLQRVDPVNAQRIRQESDAVYLSNGGS